MKRTILLYLFLLFVGIDSYAQKMIGYGAELSVLSLKPTTRMWFSKTTGIEVFGGIAAQLDDIKPNDLEVGFKFLHAIMYSRTDRTYIGIIGKWKWVDAFESYKTTSLPIPGIFIGKEWYSKRINRKGIAVELGYQYGQKEYQTYSPVSHFPLSSKTRFEEFPLILNIRYSFYQKR
jgi:hypothetical protein